MPKAQVSPSPSQWPEIIEKPSESSSSAAMGVVTPTLRIRDAASSSLAKRVPRTFQQITGRRPVHLNSVNCPKYPSGHPKEKVPMAVKIYKTKILTPKNDTPKPNIVDISRASKRLYFSEDTISLEPSSSAAVARNNPMFSLSPSQSPLPPYKVFEMTTRNGSIGHLVLNMDQLKQQSFNGEMPAKQGQGDPPQVTEPTQAIMEENKDKGTPLSPDNNNTAKKPSKKCLIM
ncbi:hypothetical protein KR038_000129 [Drosophila bunnanda]|nr:hypothetical protein KR038_000129 [Drosophila bunnanda]